MKRPRSPLGLGIIGLGGVAQSRHLPALAKSPSYKILAAFDLDRERAAAVGRKYRIPKITMSAEELINLSGLDLIAILTPPMTHSGLAHAALDAGKHVFVEKPLTLDFAEAQDLAAHVERARKKLYVGFNQRRHRLVQQARLWLQEGRLGQLAAVHSTLTNSHNAEHRAVWQNDSAQGGDISFDVAVHHFDMWRYLFESEIRRVSAERAEKDGASATVTLLAQMTNGLPITATFAEATTEHNALEIFGERGCLILSLYRFDGLQFIPRGSFDGGLNVRAQKARELIFQSVDIARRLSRGGDYELSYAAEWEHVAAGLGAVEPYEPNVYDGLAATKIALAVRQALTRRQSVEVGSGTPERIS